MQKSKYNNIRTFYRGMKFDSKAELARWVDLEFLLKVGAITDLVHHPRFKLSVNGIKICTYEADSQYQLTQGNDLVIEDVKGVKTAVYKLKAKLMLALNKIKIQEITNV